MTVKRPNILMIMADQLPAACVGAYGHPMIQTPNLDQLALRGTRFDSAYCNSPICAPSRTVAPMPTITRLPIVHACTTVA